MTFPTLPLLPPGLRAPDVIELGPSTNRFEVIHLRARFGDLTATMSNEDEGSLYPTWWSNTGEHVDMRAGRPAGTDLAWVRAAEAWVQDTFWVLHTDATQAAHRRVEEVARHLGLHPITTPA